MSDAGSTPRPIRRVGVIGTGVIGSSWAALFLAAGLEVVATDPDPNGRDKMRRSIVACWPSLQRQGLVKADSSPDRVTFVDSAAAAADGVDFVQENGPERLEIKHDLYRELDHVAGADVIIASSSSGLMASDLQSACVQHPQRVLIGHPFNPPHLIPLVEVVGGRATEEWALDAAIAFYTSLGKSPIRIRAELPGHVTNRLQAALWREAYWLVEQGVATVGDIDTAISSGPGLRWALLGPFATQHLSGGPGGLAHVLEHLGPPVAEWWETFVSPKWNEDLRRLLVDGLDQELEGVDQTAMADDRDRLLEGLIIAKGSAEHLPGRSAE